jgi:hypothetical protein
MERRSVEAIVRALNDAGVRYLVVGGLAVIAHGYLRLTVDVDLILDLREENLRRAVTALQNIGYCPRAPVPFEQFVDPSNRSRWIAEKGLTVFSLFSSRHPKTEVDLFVDAPFDFDRAYAAAMRQEVAPGLVATFASYDDLVFLKRTAGRSQDMEDIRRMQIAREKPTYE